MNEENFKELYRNLMDELKEGVYNPSAEEREQFIAKANYLFKNGKVNEVDEHRRTALHCAVLAGDEDLVNQLIDCRIPVNVFDDTLRAPLHYAVRGNNLNVMIRLLDSGADVNAYSNSYGTALQVAVRSGLVESVRLLLERGAKTHLSVKDGHDSCVLQSAVCKECDCRNRNDTNLKILRLLLNHEGNNCNEECIKRKVNEVICHGPVEALKLFVERGFNLSNLYEKTDILYDAVRNKDVNVFKYIYENVILTAKERDFHSEIVTLCHVVRWKRIDIIKYLLKGNHAEINVIFSYFIQRFPNDEFDDRVPKFLQFLLNSGADINSNVSYSIFILFTDKKIELVHVYLQHIVKLELTDRYVDPVYYRKINENPVFKEYYDQCKTEFEKTKTTFLYDGISFFELFESEDIVPFAKNLQLVEALKEYDVENEFPIYHEILTKRIRKEIRKQERIKRGIKDLSYLLKLNENSQHLILQNVICFLDKNDLKILSNI